MLEHLRITGFKSLRDVDVALRPLSVFFGPNASGKSNLLDAIQFISASSTERSLADALKASIRGYPMEAFTFPEGGLSALLASTDVSFEIVARLAVPGPRAEIMALKYSLTAGLRPMSGEIVNQGERLEKLNHRTGVCIGRPRIEPDAEHGTIRVRKRHESGRALDEKIGGNHTAVSIPSYTGDLFPEIDALRAEFRAWRVYYLEPRTAMRQAAPPQVVRDIGQSGQDLPAFLFTLKNDPDLRKHFEAIRRLVRQTISSIESIDVELNPHRAELNLVVRQSGINFSNRVISEGTLRVIALAALALNPFPARLVGLEEPENGVHPARLENLLSLMSHLAIRRGVQVLVNTHSPLFVAHAVRLQKDHPDKVGIYSVRTDGGTTNIRPLDDLLPLFEDTTIDTLLKSDEDAKLQALLVRGMLDG